MAEPAQTYVQPQAYDADGNPVPPDQAAAAVSSGKAFFQQGARVYARNPRGELVTVAPADAALPGYRVLSQPELEQAAAQKQYGEGLGNVAKAGAAGLARGATLGASDAVLSELGGDDTRRALQGLRQANPITSTVTEIGGAVAPVALSGGAAAPVAGAGALARAGGVAAGAVRAAGALPRAAAAAGSLVERGVARGLANLGYEGTSLAGRAAAGAAKLGAAGATEGAIYGGAAAANDAVLNGDEITAEKIVAGMGDGALFGAGVGGALGAAAPLASAAASKLVPKPEALTKLAQEQALKSVARGTDIRRIAGRAVGEAAEKRLAATADDLLNYKFESGPLKGERVFLPGRNTEELLERISAAKNEAGARLGGLKDELSEQMAKGGASPDVRELLQRIDDDVLAPLRKSNVPGVRARARSVERQLAGLREQADDTLNAVGLENFKFLRTGMRDDSLAYAKSAFEGASPAEARAIAMGERVAPDGRAFEPVRVDIYPDTGPVLNDGRHRLAAATEAGSDRMLAKVTRYDGEGNVVAEELRPIGIQAGVVKPTFRELDQLRSDLRSVIQPVAPSSGGMPPLPPKSAQDLERAERTIADFLKEKAGGYLAKAGDNPNAYNELNRQFSSFAKLEQIAGKNANQQLGNRMISPSDHALGMASFLGALTSGNVGAVGAMGTGAAATMANKLLRERGNSLVADMARRAAEMDGSIDRVAQVLAGRAEKAKAPALAATLQGENLRETYERTANRVRELARPQVAMQHVSSLLPEVAAQYPLVGSAVSTKLLAIYQQLAAKLPPSRVDTGTTLTPLAIRERVAPAAMRAFLANVRGTLEPERVIQELEHGAVDREAIEALKIAHPKTFMQLRSKVADYVEQNEEELPYKRRVMLSMTFDFVGDSSLEPQRLAGLQETAQALSNQEAAQDAAMVKPKTGDPGVSKIGKTMTTPMDSALSGGV